MKNFTPIVLAVALAGCGMCQDAAAAKLPEIFKCAKVLKSPCLKSPAAKKDGPMYAAKAADAAAIWRAGTQKAYGWDGEEWVLTETYEITYDDKGQKEVQTVTDEEGYVNRETYTWNDNGMLATSLTQVDEDGTGEFADYSRLAREYDSILTSFITVNDQEVYSNGQWIPSNNYTQTITRDEAGNVTQMERAVYFQGVYDPTYRLNISYGEDGKANTIVVEELTYDYDTNQYAWVETEKYTDIVWMETDGQIVGTDDFYTGANKIKSATVIIEDEAVVLNVEYNGESFVATMTIGEDGGFQVRASLAYDVLDFDGETAHLNHGFKSVNSTELLMAGQVMAKEEVTETGIYTSDDLIILEKVEYDDGEATEIYSMIEGEVVYDEEKGYPLSWTVSEYDWETDEMIPSFRAEYSDYTNFATSGITEAMTAEDSAAVYYNLQGQKVQNPTAGLYIKVNGSEARKVMLP